MIRLEIENCNMILTKKQKKYQHYHKHEYLTGKEMLPPDQRKMIT